MACCVKLTMNKCFLCLFTILIFVLFLVYALISAILVGQELYLNDYVNVSCQQVREGKVDQMSEYEQKAFSYIEDLDKKIGDAVNKNMCTNWCPCF